MDFRLTDERNGVDAEAELRALAKRQVPATLATGRREMAMSAGALLFRYRNKRVLSQVLSGMRAGP